MNDEEFTIYDLQDGDLVEYKNGAYRLYKSSNGGLYNRDGNMVGSIKFYTKDFKNFHNTPRNDLTDIVKVYRGTISGGFLYRRYLTRYEEKQLYESELIYDCIEKKCYIEKPKNPYIDVSTEDMLNQMGF